MDRFLKRAAPAAGGPAKKARVEAAPKKGSPKQAETPPRAGAKQPVDLTCEKEAPPAAAAPAELAAQFGEKWEAALRPVLTGKDFTACLSKVAAERSAGKKVYPPEALMFNAFKLTPLDSVRVVVVGQDPYHQPGQAMGLSFSVPRGIKVPSSLQNIYKEAKVSCSHGNLTTWAQQGVFLLNASLSVEDSKPNSHQGYGWEKFTDQVIAAINSTREGVIFLLWGNNAKKKGSKIDRKKHVVLESVHPSGLSAHRGFFGCDHFAKVNEVLRARGQPEIRWNPDAGPAS